MYLHTPNLIVKPPEDRYKGGILAVDPGPGCGFATYHPYPGIDGMNFTTWTADLAKDGHGALEIIVRQEYFRFQDFVKDLNKPGENDLANIVAIGEKVLVVEKFEFRKDDVEQREKIDFTAAEYVGVLKLLGEKQFNKLVMQGSAQAVGKAAFWTDDKLRHLNICPIGTALRHQRDALRHLLYYMTFTLKQEWLLEPLKDMK